MLVKEAMTKTVRTVRPDSTATEAAKEMNKYRIGSLIVISGSKIEGILTERDILRGVVAEDRSASEVNVSEIMTKEVVVVSSEISLEEAADVMTKYKIKKLPVVENGQLVGIITSTDLISYEKNLIEKIAFLLSSGEAPNIEGKGIGG